MITTQLTEIKFKALVRESVKDAFRIEFIKLRVLLVPSVSDEEQSDIERLYKRPSRKSVVNHEIEI